MPRASNGVYSLPSGNPVVTGTTIASTWANTTMSDIATAMTDSLDRSGFGGMLASLQLFAGTAGSPGLSWSVETNSGLYRNAAGDFRYSIAATDVLKLTSTQLLVGGTTAPGFAAVLGVVSAGSTNVSVHNTANSIETLLSASGTGGIVGAFTNHPFEIRTNNTQRVNITAGGNVVINAPGSGVALTVTNANANSVATFNAGNASGGFLTYQANGSDSSYWGSANRVFSAGVNDIGITSLGANQLILGTNSLARIVITGAGNATINAPTSGVALTLADGGGIVNRFSIGAATGNGSVIQFLGASAAQGKSWLIGNQFNVSDTFEITPSTANGGSTFTTPAFKISGGGAVVIAAPTSGVALTIAGLANSNVAVFNGSSTSGQSFGPAINAGTTSADYAINVQNQSGALAFFRVRGDGAVFGNDGTSLFELGYKDVPQNVQNVNYQLVLSDRGKQIAGGSGTLTYTIPANASVSFPTGTVITFVNVTGNPMSIAITSDTLVLAGTATTGTRTLANNGLATAVKYSATAWLISGAGLT